MFKKLFVSFLAAASAANAYSVSTSLVAHNASPASEAIGSSPAYQYGAGADQLCNVCVQVVVQEINVLLNAILNGDIATCGKLCGNIDNKAVAGACDLVCDAVGITAFIKVLTNNTLLTDPLRQCQLIGVCSDCIGASSTPEVVAQTQVSSDKAVSSFTFTITQATCAGMLRIGFTPYRTQTTVQDTVVKGLEPNTYTYNIEVDFTSEDDNGNKVHLPAGPAGLEFTLCDGACGTTDAHHAQIVHGVGNFTIPQ